MLDEALRLARDGRVQAETDLAELIAIPSVSALPEHRENCRRAAEWLVRKLAKMGMAARLEDVSPHGHPVVVAEWRGRPGAPLLTIYGHYDVQPPDPLAEWESPPFEAARRDGYFYARGADDNKGQHLASVVAAERWFAAGGPPVNLRFLIEGEEEVSGRSLPEYVRQHAAELATDYLWIADGSFVAPRAPSLLTGLRGLLYTEIAVRGPRVDLHSGIFGGVAPNPFNSLCHILAELKDRNGRVRIPGFYDAVVPPTKDELEGWRRLPLDGGGDLFEPVGEEGYSPIERRWARPTLDVHGMVGGFTGEGAKTVIPAHAKAKMSMRLVPEQSPARVLEELRAFAPQLALPGTTVEVIELAEAPPVRLDTSHPGVEAAARAFELAFGARPAFVREGGSIPVVSDFKAALNTRLLVSGFGLPGDALHSPNERFSLDQYHRGAEMVIHLMGELSAAHA